MDVRKAYLSRKKAGRKWRGGWSNRRRRTRRHQWRTETTCPKDVRFKTEVGKVIGYLNKRDEAESMLDDFGIDEAAFMCKEQGGRFEDPRLSLEILVHQHTWLVMTMECSTARTSTSP